MKWRNVLLVAVRSIMKNRMRSFLTMLGIIIGVGAVILMVAVGEGVQQQIERQIAGLGSNLLIVFSNAGRQGGVSLGAGSGTPLSLADVEKLQTDAGAVSAVSAVARVGVQAIGGIGNWSTSLMGVNPSYLEVRDWSLTSGEFFTDREMRARAKVCVIGKVVADNLFPDQDPIGQQIRLRNVPFRIIGVLTEKGQSAGGQDQDDAILAPATTVLDRLSGNRNIQQIIVSASSDDRMDEAQQQVTELLREAHRLQPGEEDDFTVRSQTEIAQAAQSTTEVLTLLLAAIAGVSLVVGGIGIMNIMLVSVTERTREIGIRMAIGARGSDVLTQFLVESVVLSLLGGIIGILSGIGAAALLSKLTGIATAINPMVVTIAFLFSAAIGVFFGFYPARRAASLNPIEALRYE